MSLGIAAGAFAQNYAAAKGLKSRLASEKQQQELTDIELQSKREFRDLQKQQGDLYKQFIDPNFDFVGNKPYEVQQGGITPPGQVRPEPYMDSARVNAYYDRMAPMMERQAQLTGKDPLLVRREIQNMRKEQFVERVGNALAMIYAGNEEGIKGLQGAYQLFPDGRTITGGKINQDGSVLLQYEQGGTAGEKVISRDQLMELGKLALNPADAVKLRVQLAENQKNRKHETDLTDKKITATATENDKNRTAESQIVDRRIKASADEGAADRASREKTAGQDRASRERMNAEDNRVRQTVADTQQRRDAETEAQKYFRNRFSVPQFTPKPESEVKNLFGEQKKAYERDLQNFTERESLARTADNIFGANQGLPKSKIAQVTEGLRDKKYEVFQEDGSGRRFVTESGKRIYLD